LGVEYIGEGGPGRGAPAPSPNPIHKRVALWAALFYSKPIETLGAVEGLRAERNQLSEEVGLKKKAGQHAEAQPLMDRVGGINEAIKGLEGQVAEHDSWVRDFLLILPNVPHSSVPLGASGTTTRWSRPGGRPPGSTSSLSSTGHCLYFAFTFSPGLKGPPLMVAAAAPVPPKSSVTFNSPTVLSDV
jgi:hypothetical protein